MQVHAFREYSQQKKAPDYAKEIKEINNKLKQLSEEMGSIHD